MACAANVKRFALLRNPTGRSLEQCRAAIDGEKLARRAQDFVRFPLVGLAAPRHEAGLSVRVDHSDGHRTHTLGPAHVQRVSVLVTGDDRPRWNRSLRGLDPRHPVQFVPAPQELPFVVVVGPFRPVPVLIVVQRG
uniref:(northern house mosquito) hypothetical protein n=1 Tax=Culex pipiens TaxID=7175 RepID=A0A8D8MFS2_CULPI